ncbi:MAG: hypothetical protein NTV51_24040 [Verrucomicrobia bacterium]|nr:hypothetical protein [Verrucomicrobiota bacterium]
MPVRLLLLVTLFIPCLYAADAPRVAVMDFSPPDAAGVADAATVDFSREVQARLLVDSDYVWVERQEFDRIVSETNLLALGGSDPAAAMRLGHWLHADLIVRGEFRPAALKEGELRLEVIDPVRADVLASRVLPAKMTVGRRLHPAAGETEATAAAVLSALAEAKAARAKAADQIVVAPLYFKNAGSSERLNFLEERLGAGVAAAATREAGCRLLRFPRPAEASEETELALGGLTDADPKAWQKVADVYLWGSFEETGGEGRPFEEVPVKITVQVWNGAGAPRDVNWTGSAGELAAGVRTVASEALRAARELDRAAPRDEGERGRVAAALADRAREILRKMDQNFWVPPNMAKSDFVRSAAGRQLHAYRLRLLDTACFSTRSTVRCSRNEFRPPGTRQIHWPR